MQSRTSNREAPPPAPGLVLGEDGRWRCWWCGNDPLYVEYHDREWGVPTLSDQRLFEKICLEGFQSGLSWLTILRKREGFRQAFLDFDFRQVAEFGKPDIERLMEDASIVRHRGKIASTINNARRACWLTREFGSLAAYFWRWKPSAASRPTVIDLETVRSLKFTRDSTALAKDLKKRGWSFVGPTTAYAFMQAMGLVNDHLQGCWRRPEVESFREALEVPTGTPGVSRG